MVVANGKSVFSRTLSIAASTLLAITASCAAACSGSSQSAPPTASTGKQGPLSGTYAADSLEGTAPFVAITFLDETHYSYIAKSCFAAPAGGGADNTGNPVTGQGGAPGAAPGPAGEDCIHAGTYDLAASNLTLNDDSGAAFVTLPLAELAPNGTEVSGSTAAVSGTSTIIGSNLVAPASSGLLFDKASVSAFAAGGTALRRTGLTTGSGVGSTCTIGDGTAGTCTLTSTCAADGKTSTPDFCPGAEDVQCCTARSGGNTGGTGGPGTTGSNGGGNDDSGGSSDPGGSGGGARLVSNNAVDLAEQWVAVKMPYCEAANHARDYDTSCSSTCTRTGAADQPQWNAYRSDCSGLVSYAWGLAAPGLTTWQFVPGTAQDIPTQDLQPGDALLNPQEHVVLFKSWIDKASGKATVISEPGCALGGTAPNAQEQTWSLGGAPPATSSASWSGGTYYAIRKNGGTLVH